MQVPLPKLCMSFPSWQPVFAIVKQLEVDSPLVDSTIVKARVTNTQHTGGKCGPSEDLVTTAA